MYHRQWKSSGFQAISRLQSKLASLSPAQSTAADVNISEKLIADMYSERR
jgi:hypothetical protein